MAGATSIGSVRGDIRTVWIAGVWPELAAGRFPVKRVVGDTFEVSADILREGHEALAAVLKYRTVKDTTWREVPMHHVDNDRWVGRFPLEENTRYLYTLEAYPDAYRSWAVDLEKRLAADMEVASELLEGAALLRPALARAVGADKKRIEERLAELERATTPLQQARILLADDTAELVENYPDRSAATMDDRELEDVVDRPLAQLTTSYEMLPHHQRTVVVLHAPLKCRHEPLPDIENVSHD